MSLALGAQILRLAGRVSTAKEGLELLNEKLKSGEGLKKLQELIVNQGGDSRVAYDTSLLPKAERKIEVAAERDGYVSRIITDDIGYAAKALGAGRTRKEDPIDPAVGLVMNVRLGDYVKKGQSLVTLHVNGGRGLTEAKQKVLSAIELAAEKPVLPTLIYEEIE